MNQWNNPSPFPSPPLAQPPTVYQPLHPSLRGLLDPEYVAFHDTCLQYLIPEEQLKWDTSTRSRLPTLASPSAELKVGQKRDIQLEHCAVRVFVPESSQHVPRYPVLLWFHSGGWVSGGLDSENDFLTYVCQTSQCIVITVDYRLAPEHPYPAAAEDALEALTWLRKEAAKYYPVDLERVAIGGHSTGGNLAAVLVLEAACLFPSFKPVLMLLIVPVIDNTATPGNGWYNLNAPWLTHSRLLWYRSMYLPEGPSHEDDYSTREKWQISPNLAPSKVLSKCPRTWIAVAEYDLLATETLAFSSQLRASGVEASVKMYNGSTHGILALNGILSKGRELMLDAVQALNEVFWPVRMDPLMGWALSA
ncbi:AB hydrolase superfamily protein [Cercospora beticola]|uniref:AB hydrolase superfamily protein n=1 Tax=Cercospora beticola TaxID=122368 RepID=A0A2G5H830_CERBT|nr:AB hydrolase superfamily protein [Cercospora beticola]PIA88690.1 AB hydrolase superfamily protein [Cercospora beticola]WPB02889.1 hypothetical protein RHO25_007525 [Cercospora beticola]CAK1358415.1 unnamed protein product [Cercospora beticola]